MCVLMLQACSLSTKPSTSVNIPANLIVPCPALENLNGSSGQDVLPWAMAVVGRYNDCAQRHEALVNTLITIGY